MLTTTQDTSGQRGPKSSFASESNVHVRPPMVSVKPPGNNSPGPRSKLRLNIVEPREGTVGARPSIVRIRATAGPIRKIMPIIARVIKILAPYFLIDPLVNIVKSTLFINIINHDFLNFMGKNSDELRFYIVIPRNLYMRFDQRPSRGTYMHLFVMIPAHNEESTIAQVIRTIPKKTEGITKLSVVVIDDGSTDKTAQIARRERAHVVSHNMKQGLAQTFQQGLNICLKNGANIIVNIDGDGQYDSSEIPKIIKPIVEGWADVVLTNRKILSLDHMPFSKKYGNLLATWVTRVVSGFPVRDAQSGFRAFSREAALRLNIRGSYTYVQETIIQAIDKRLKIVQTNCTFRKRADNKSRLIESIWDYAKRAGSMLLRSYVRYKPLKVFLVAGMLVNLPGFFFTMRYLWLWINGQHSGHVQSLIAAAILLIVGFQIMMLALLSDTIDAERTINEESLYRLKKIEFGKNF